MPTGHNMLTIEINKGARELLATLESCSEKHNDCESCRKQPRCRQIWDERCCEYSMTEKMRFKAELEFRKIGVGK